MVLFSYDCFRFQIVSEGNFTKASPLNKKKKQDKNVRIYSNSKLWAKPQGDEMPKHFGILAAPSPGMTKLCSGLKRYKPPF